MPGEPALRVTRLTHRYAKSATAALSGVTLSAQAGERLVLLGPNGSGKSTLLRIACTLLTPTSGEVSVFGSDVRQQASQARLHLGVVFQQPAVDTLLTARENLMHQGRLYGLARRVIRPRSDHWLAFFDLASRADEPLSRLSGGMRRKVELAKALLHEPRLLLMDEPTTGLDPAARAELGELLRRLSQRGIACVMTTHLMEEAEAADTVALLHAGELLALGSPGELRRRLGESVVEVRPRDPSAAALLVERYHAVVSGDVARLSGQGVSLDELRPLTLTLRAGEPSLDDVLQRLVAGAGSRPASPRA